MLMLLLQAGDETYALEADRVNEVIPRVETRPLPHAPDYVVGVVNYGGQAVPLIDLSLLMGGQASRRRLSTRIILVQSNSADGASQVVGLLAERVTETVRVQKEDFISGNMSLGAPPYVGKAILCDGRIIPCLHVDRLLSDSLCPSWAPQSTENT